MVTTTVEGRERFGVGVRYPRELRSDPDSDRPQRAGARAWTAAMVPLGQLAKLVVRKGPPAIRTENALLSVYVFVDIRGRDIGGYVADAQRAVREQVKLEPGYFLTWSGQFEYMQRAIQKLKVVIPRDAADRLPAPVPELQSHRGDADRAAFGAVRTRGRRLVAVSRSTTT